MLTDSPTLDPASLLRLTTNDLEWEDDCLKFNENKRLVRTKSNDQVRQPLYKKSVERWRNYEKHIQPLIEILATNPADTTES